MKLSGVHVKGLKIGKDGKVTCPPKYRNVSQKIAARKRPKQKFKPVSR